MRSVCNKEGAYGMGDKGRKGEPHFSGELSLNGKEEDQGQGEDNGIDSDLAPSDLNTMP